MCDRVLFPSHPSGNVSRAGAKKGRPASSFSELEVSPTSKVDRPFMDHVNASRQDKCYRPGDFGNGHGGCKVVAFRRAFVYASILSSSLGGSLSSVFLVQLSFLLFLSYSAQNVKHIFLGPTLTPHTGNSSQVKACGVAAIFDSNGTESFSIEEPLRSSRLWSIP